MSDNPRPPSVPSPIYLDGSINRCVEDIELSRVRPGSGTVLPPVGIQAGSGSSYDGRPGSGARGTPTRPGTSTRMAAGGGQEVVPEQWQMSKKDPLPPISTRDSDDGSGTEVTESYSAIIGNTMAGGPVRARQVVCVPRIVSYRPGIELDNIFIPEPPSTPKISRTPSLAMPEQRTVTSLDGREIIVKSVDCQTEWSWIKDMQRMSSTPADKFSRTSTTRSPTQTPSGPREEELLQADDLDLDQDDLTKSAPSRPREEELLLKAVLDLDQDALTKSEPRLSARQDSQMPSVQTHTASKAQRSQQSKVDLGRMTPGEDTPGVQPGYEDDTYGIPLLELSSDSESSDEELFDEEEYKKQAVEAATKETMTLPCVGPPQILQYQRESVKKPLQLEEQEGVSKSSSKTIFQGLCEYCGVSIKPIPSLEDQNNLPPAELYCCNEYREFIQFMLTQAVEPPPEEDEKTKLIDIAPHAPHGSRQARRAANERAAQRMREREIQRQQVQVLGIGSGFGGAGGGGGNSNLYHFPEMKTFSDNVPRGGHSRRTSVATNMSFYAMSMVARQMKTINYQLSSQKCLEEGWTLRPPSPMLDQDSDNDCFEPQPVLPHWAEGANKDKKDAGLVQKYYPDGSNFVILFPDGTGNVYYPSGRPAISILSVEKGLFTHIVHADSDDEPTMLAVFGPEGHATSYHNNGVVRICLDQMGGTELDPRGSRKRIWTWKDQVEHVHAPPIQPITFAITPHLAVRIGGQESITLTYSHSAKSCRFQVGARLKLVNKESVPVPELDEEMLYREEVKNRIETLFTKVSNLLKFPKSPKLDKLPGPAHVSSRQEKVERLRESYSRSAKDKDKKGSMSVITVN